MSDHELVIYEAGEAGEIGWKLCEECTSEQNRVHVMGADLTVLRARTQRPEG